MENLTPMLKQYQEIKSRHQDCVLFFRLGDFYEMFGDDARRASGILDVVLTSRDGGKAGRIPMCGIPYHAADTYIAKLIKAGLKVAICEQTEDPATAKTLVKRDVIRTITSGTYIDESSFEARYLIALSFKEKSFGFAFTDTASGIMYTNEYTSLQRFIEVISKISFYECLYPQEEETSIKELFKDPLLRNARTTFSPLEDWFFNTDIAQKTLLEHFHTHSLRGFGIEDAISSVAASGALLEYLKLMHKQPLRHIHKISLYLDSEHVYISPAACYGLGLESLIATMDHTLTWMGKRKLNDWLYHPLKEKEAILKRQNAVTLLRENPQLKESLGKQLHGIPDIEKSISRISCGFGSPRDLAGLRATLAKQPEIKKTLSLLEKENRLFCIEDLPKLRELLNKAISPEIPLSHPEGHIIHKGYSLKLDQLRDIRENGRDWLKQFQAQEITRTGIHSLKVGFNQVFGYYIEISKANVERAPQDYIRKQTLAQGERYITPELKEFEEKALSAQEKILSLERELIAEIFKAVLDNATLLHVLSNAIATLDVLYSLCVVSLQHGYRAPQISQTTAIEIKDGRHPVVEKSITEPFIPNDTLLDSSDNHLIILTGPNMAGKSTYIRQNALLVIMAQMGSYIPAASATIGIVDKIFTRIGAHDEITKGQSTFMVEMSETAGILNNLSEKSLVVLDEIGRGTSTFDGLSLAWAIAEHLAEKKVRTLFATHFHELTALAEEFPGIRNYNVQVKEWNGEVIFLHKIVAGGTDDSYGIYVAKLAGIPKEVIKRSEQILMRLELGSDLQEKIRKRTKDKEQLTLFVDGNRQTMEEIKKEILAVDLNLLTPLEALNKLHALKKRLDEHE